MTSKFRLFALGAMLGFGAVSFSGQVPRQALYRFPL